MGRLRKGTEAEEDGDEIGKILSIFKAKAEKIFKDTKKAKALGDDHTPMEMLKELREEYLKVQPKMINDVCVTGKCREDDLNITIIALNKKQQVKKFRDYRTIDHITHRKPVQEQLIGDLNRKWKNY